MERSIRNDRFAPTFTNEHIPDTVCDTCRPHMVEGPLFAPSGSVHPIVDGQGEPRMSSLATPPLPSPHRKLGHSIHAPAQAAALPSPRVFNGGVFELIDRGHCALLD